MGDALPLAEESTDRLAERARAGDDAALRELLPRLTLRAFLTAGEPSQRPEACANSSPLPNWARPLITCGCCNRLHL